MNIYNLYKISFITENKNNKRGKKGGKKHIHFIYLLEHHSIHLNFFHTM